MKSMTQREYYGLRKLTTIRLSIWVWSLIHRLHTRFTPFTRKCRRCLWEVPGGC